MANDTEYLEHLIRPAAGSGPSPLLVLLHGVGSDMQDLFGLSPYIDPRFLVVSAQGPFPISFGGWGWFELAFPPTGPRIKDPKMIQYSIDRLMTLIDHIIETHDINQRHVYLAGFSQGAILTAAVLLRDPSRIAGGVLMSGRLIDDIVPMQAPDGLDGKPLLMVHGRYDQVIRIADARAAKNVLGAFPFDLEYEEYDMAHEVNNDSLERVTQWLRRRVDQA